MKLLSQSDHKKVESIIKTAGKKLVQYVNRTSLREKYADSLQSVVTQAGLDTEHFLREKFKKLFPEIGFYSEETFHEAPEELEKEYCWVVDPIDGTLNFSRGLPLFGISVALMHNQKPVAGHIYLPVLNEYFSQPKEKVRF